MIINPVSTRIDVDAYLGLLAVDGTLVNVGVPAEPLSLNVFSRIGARHSYAGSMIGGIALTQEMLDFCAKVEVIPANQVNEAYERGDYGRASYHRESRDHPDRDAGSRPVLTFVVNPTDWASIETSQLNAGQYVLNAEGVGCAEFPVDAALRRLWDVRVAVVRQPQLCRNVRGRLPVASVTF